MKKTNEFADQIFFQEKVKFTINFNKNSFPFECPVNQTVSDLRQEIAKQTGVAAALQKLMFKGEIFVSFSLWKGNLCL